MGVCLGGYGLGKMVVISGLCAISGLCELRGGRGGIGGRLRRMEARSCCVSLAGCLSEAMETAGGVSTMGISGGISVDEVSREGEETMVMAEVSGSGLPSPLYVVTSLAGTGSDVERSGRGKASPTGIVVVIEGSNPGVVPCTMAVVGGVLVVNVRLASAWRLMMRA